MKGWMKVASLGIAAAVFMTSGAGNTIAEAATAKVQTAVAYVADQAEDVALFRQNAQFIGVGVQNRMSGRGVQQNPGMNRNNGAQKTLPQPNIPFEDNGQIQELMPVPQGNHENPQIDQRTMQETQQLGELTESEDYSYVYLLGDVSDEEYETFSTYLDMVVAGDSDLIQLFDDSGWQIVLTSADLDDLLFRGQSSGVEGCTYFNKHVIYVHAGDYSYCVIHELGHFLDYASNYASYGQEFEEIYRAEAASLTEYGQTSAQEFFAEVYCYSYLEPDTLAGACPQALAFVEDCLEHISE